MQATTSLVPEHPNSAIRKSCDAALIALARFVDGLRPQSEADFAGRERLILGALNELGRRLIQADLQRLADSYPNEVEVRGRRYRRHARGTVAYHTLCGDVAVQRCTYRQADVRNGPTLVPVELEAGIIGDATPALAHSVAHGIAEMTSRHLEETLHRAHRQPPSRSTLERLGKYIGGGVKRDALVLEHILRVEERLPDGAHAIAVGLDRTSVPMAEERPASQAPLTPRKPRRKPRQRRAPHPVDVVYRMAYVGTVAVVDANGEALVTRKYVATAEEGPDELVRRVMADVIWLRRARPLDLVVVQDGAPELWNVMQQALAAAAIKTWHKAVDRFHVTERIAAVLAEVIRDPGERRARFEHWRGQLEHSDRAVVRFADWMWQLRRDPRLWNRIGSHHNYLDGYARNGFTKYRTLRDRGFPTASGITEGACKSLVTVRAKRSGQRWQQDGLTAVLTLRAFLQSDRFDRLWPLVARRYTAEVRCLN